MSEVLKDHVLALASLNQLIPFVKKYFITDYDMTELYIIREAVEDEIDAISNPEE